MTKIYEQTDNPTYTTACEERVYASGKDKFIDLPIFRFPN